MVETRRGEGAAPWWRPLEFLVAAQLIVPLASCEWSGDPNLTNRPSRTDLREPDLAHSAPERPTRSPALPVDAGEVVDRLSQAFPDNAAALLAQGTILESFGQSDEALWCWQRCLAVDSQCAAAHQKIGLVAMDQGNFDLAAGHLRQSCEIAPESPEAAIYLGKALLSQGQNSEAIEVLEAQLERGSPWPESWFQLGQANVQLEKYARASECYQAALRLDPSFRSPWFGLSQLHARLGDPARARECREKFQVLYQLQTAPEQDRWRNATDEQRDHIALARALTVAADVYETLGHAPEAQAQWRKAAELDANNFDCRLALGESLVRENRPADAIVVWEELLENKSYPRPIELLISLSTLNQRLKQFEPAEQCLQRALGMEPENALVLSELVKLGLATNTRLAEAQILAERLVRLQPTEQNFWVFSRVCVANRDPQRVQAVRDEISRKNAGDSLGTQAVGKPRGD